MSLQKRALAEESCQVRSVLDFEQHMAVSQGTRSAHSHKIWLVMERMHLLQHASGRAGSKKLTANKFLTPSLSGTLYWEIMPQAGMRALLLHTFKTASSICSHTKDIKLGTPSEHSGRVTCT